MSDQKVDPRNLLANERTFLAWMRTGISLMAFGFVVAKFDVFLHIATRHPYGHGWFGMILVIAGVVINIVATRYFRINQQRLQKNEELIKSYLPEISGIASALIGLAVVIYLFRST
ncbi:MAG: DUF202 domain-containing protein [Firmicutes bacterium]|nr:DUF202 domain-containing protein [Bacillota bacterium]